MSSRGNKAEFDKPNIIADIISPNYESICNIKNVLTKVWITARANSQYIFEEGRPVIKVNVNLKKVTETQ